jgi:hypothetical protein
MQKRLPGALCAALLFVAPARAAEQSSYVAPISGPMSMSTFAGSYLNPGLRALASCSWGSSAPANGPSGAPLPYQCWADTTSSPVLFKYYDGASWVTYGALDTSTHAWTPYLTGGTSGGVPYFSSAGVMGTSAVLAQYGFLIGSGAGAAPSSIAACTDDQIAFSRTGNSPLCRTVTGDVTFSSGAASIGIGTNVQAYDSDLAALAANSINGLWARTGGWSRVRADHYSACRWYHRFERKRGVRQSDTRARKRSVRVRGTERNRYRTTHEHRCMVGWDTRRELGTGSAGCLHAEDERDGLECCSYRC